MFLSLILNLISLHLVIIQIFDIPFFPYFAIHLQHFRMIKGMKDCIEKSFIFIFIIFIQ